MHAQGKHRWTLRFGPLMLLDQDTGELHKLKADATVFDAIAEADRIDTTHTVEDLRNSWNEHCGSCRSEQRFLENHEGDMISCQTCGNTVVL